MALTAAVASDPEHRQWWATPDALAGLPGWVDAALATHGRRRTGPLRQRKTWNLSLMVSAPTEAGDVWVKATPPFLADEGGIMARVGRRAPDLVPTVLAHDPGRRLVLMHHVPGEDQFGLADGPLVARMAARWVDAQAKLVDDVEHLLALGAADLRSSALCADAVRLAERRDLRADLGVKENAALDHLVDGLPSRLADAEACGLPDTVVHNDAHPGNWRWDGSGLVLLDWADVGVGSPAFDLRAFAGGLSGAQVGRGPGKGATAWATRWRTHADGCDPERAAALLAPVSHLRAAFTYARFLDHIEATERVYHAHDPAEQVRAGLSLGAR